MRSEEELRCQPDVPCSFPYVYNRELHYECINMTDPDQRLWCSTKTDPRSKKHMIGHWKHCDSECGSGTSKSDPRSQLSPMTQATNNLIDSVDMFTQNPVRIDKTPLNGTTKARKYSDRPKRSLMGILDGGSPTPSKDCMTTTGSKNPNKPCVFPFKYRGKIYYSCAWVIFHITKGPWCSTQVDEDGNHIRGQYGVCQPEKCPIPPRECGKSTKERGLEDRANNVTIQSVPWMTSLGKIENEEWVHQCGGSLITNYHILTAAHCFALIELPEYPYKARLGNENLLEGSAEIRDVVSVLRHPKYRSGRAYFDVGLAIMGKKVEFTDYILPVCLPYLPVDDTDDLADTFAILTGWGEDNSGKRAISLSVENLQILPLSHCSDVFSVERVSKFGIAPIKLRQQIPTGITPEVICVGSPILVGGSCVGDSGSPIIRPRSDTARDRYYEAVALVSGGVSCALEAQIYTRLTNRQILTWIQRNTDTSPYLMVIGGYNENEFNGLLRDVELISAEPNNLCTKRVRPLNGRVFNVSGNTEYEAGTLGMTGQVTKDAAIVCGGKNGDDNLNTCHKYLPLDNDWIKSPVSGELPNMLEPRFYAGSALDEQGNMWVLGGSKGGASADSTEVFNFRSKRWQPGRPLPGYYRDSGLNSHCVVSLNKTHVVIAGGYADQFTLTSNRGESIYNAGESQDKSWMYDGYRWNELESMSTRRDRPACSLVQTDEGKLFVLAAGGCDKWCAKNPAISSAEILDPETGKWSPVADLPIPLMSAQMQVFDGYPTIVGGYDNRDRNGKMFQYIIEEDRWYEHPTAKLRIPRSSAAVIQVPKNMFDDC
eukprot:TCALIF_05926-PA protein Name:"Similar to snk Serine protease snake (Drosophila melanogaster)" AED:0.19 eAED:0.19 QI:0/0.83/0.71/0.85/0.66/0.71/7/188/824